MRVIGQTGAPFDFVTINGKHTLLRADGRIVAVFAEGAMEIPLDDSDSPSWEKGPANWGQFISRIASRLRVSLPSAARPAWAGGP
jgi:hypothetical protein